jgi:hypothetical protein
MRKWALRILPELLDKELLAKYMSNDICKDVGTWIPNGPNLPDAVLRVQNNILPNGKYLDIWWTCFMFSVSFK